LRQWLQQKIASLLQGIAGEKVEKQLKVWLDRHLADWNGLGFLCHSGIKVLENGQEQALVLFLLQQVQKEIALPQTRKKMEKFLTAYGEMTSKPQSNDAFGWLKSLLYEGAKAFNMINFADAARALQEELIVMLKAMENPEHPVRLWLRGEVYEIFRNLSEQEEKQRSFLAWQRELVAEINFSDLTDRLVTSLIEDVSPQNRATKQGKADLLSRPVTAWIVLELERFWSRFLQDSPRQSQAELLVQEFLQKLVSSHHQWIGELVYEVLTHLSDARLNQLIEEKVGADLQWVRINGALVGGFVGLVLSLFLHCFYN
ncbi:MAG: DUF445 family protein, partial [Sporomusaceae bacterium]|nr:DUF445 family protein [Sporomusaceae bacterium]